MPVNRNERQHNIIKAKKLTKWQYNGHVGTLPRKPPKSTIYHPKKQKRKRKWITKNPKTSTRKYRKSKKSKTTNFIK